MSDPANPNKNSWTQQLKLNIVDNWNYDGPVGIELDPNNPELVKHQTGWKFYWKSILDHYKEPLWFHGEKQIVQSILPKIISYVTPSVDRKRYDMAIWNKYRDAK
jgi:hypothetical protein